jgi:hypothetical protein
MAGKARSPPLERNPVRWPGLAYKCKTRKTGVKVTNTLAYYGSEIITTVKSFYDKKCGLYLFLGL